MVGGWVRSTFQSLGQREYRILWIGTTFAFLAFMMSSIVQSVVAFDLTGKNGAVGTVSLGMGLSTLFVAPFGGVLADRLSKRMLLLVGQTTIGASFAVVGLLIITDQLTIFWLAASTFVLGATFSFIAPARQAWIGDLLPTESLPNGIALQQLGMTITRVVGPFIAGGLIALSFVGTGGAYLAMSGLFVIIVATLAKVPEKRRSRMGRQSSIREDLLLGVRHLAERPHLFVLAASFIGIVIAGFSYQVVLPGYLKHAMDREPRDISLLFGIGAVAGLVVTIVLAGMSDSRHAFGLMQGGSLLMAAGLLLTAIAPGFGVALAAMLLVGGGSSAFQLLNNSLVMQEADPAYYGRVMSLVMLAWGLNGLVAFPFGILADRAGERETLFLMGALVLAVSIATAVGHALVRRRVASGPLAAVEFVVGD